MVRSWGPRRDCRGRGGDALIGMFFTKDRRSGHMMGSTIIGALIARGAEDMTRAEFSGPAEFAAISLLFILAAERNAKASPFVYAPENPRLEPQAAMAVSPASAPRAPRVAPAADRPLSSRTGAVDEPVGDASPSARQECRTGSGKACKRYRARPAAQSGSEPRRRVRRHRRRLGLHHRADLGRRGERPCPLRAPHQRQLQLDGAAGATRGVLDAALSVVVPAGRDRS